ncbi:TDT family transporter [Nocardioides sp.]|uniref:TDT family transporter n=1 Tax=Nocardioides sp. TaxID=35761 RepID=UPI00262982A1|nr:TDT family transporter [Nocardioides sp.]
MTSTTIAEPAPAAPSLGTRRSLAAFGPNWFASVMGTGIVANAAATLPVQPPGLLDAARAVWVLDAALLLVVVVATGVHWLHHPVAARRHLDDPTMAHFYGAPAMALLTVGAGALLVGQPLIGTGPAVALGAVLWIAGTLLGLATAVAVPYRAFTTHRVGADAAFGGWLMPVVPPMVSAATGPLLIAHLPAGDLRLTLHLACLMMFGLTLVVSLMIITLIWGRLMHHQVGAAAAVPTLWIVLGPLGQSITASHTLAATAPASLPAPYGDAVATLDVLYGAPMWGFALLWASLALALTVRAARTTPAGLPFTLTWWSFTFPVGTLVTGTSGLAAATGAPFLVVAAVALYVALVAAWLLVATRTLRGVRTGHLLRGSAVRPAVASVA